MNICLGLRHSFVLTLLIFAALAPRLSFAVPLQGRLLNNLEYGKAQSCGKGLADEAPGATPILKSGSLSLRLLKPADLGDVTKVLVKRDADPDQVDALSPAQVAELLKLGGQRFDQFPKGGIFNVGIFREQRLLATAQLAHTEFTPPKKGETIPEGEVWAEVSYQISPNLGPLSRERDSLSTEIVRAIGQFAFTNLRVGGLHARTTLSRRELLKFVEMNGMAESMKGLDPRSIPEVMEFTFAQSRLEYETSDDVLGATPVPGIIPPLQFSDTVKDSITLQAIHALKDPAERERARYEYYPAPEPRWKRWMAAGALGLAGLFGLDLAYTFVQDPTWVKGLAMIPAIVMGIFAADYANSEFHWGLDNTFYNSNSPILRDLARDARIHHEDPQACLRKTYLGRLSEIGPVAIAGFLATAALLKSAIVGDAVDNSLAMLGVAKSTIGATVDFTLATFLGSFLFAGWHGTMTHQMAHDPQPPWIWRMLQKARISIPQKMHMAHHKPPYDQIYSTQTGWIDWFHSREYWHARMRRYYERTGKMPGTWIQDPTAIPKDIVEKLREEYETNVAVIPMELWMYAPRAYPRRVPPELKGPLEFVQQRWRADFILRRQREYQYAGRVNLPWAQERWLEEQKQYPWIYGPTPQPLDLEL